MSIDHSSVGSSNWLQLSPHVTWESHRKAYSSEPPVTNSPRGWYSNSSMAGWWQCLQVQLSSFGWWIFDPNSGNQLAAVEIVEEIHLAKMGHNNTQKKPEVFCKCRILDGSSDPCDPGFFLHIRCMKPLAAARISCETPPGGVPPQV